MATRTSLVRLLEYNIDGKEIEYIQKQKLKQEEMGGAELIQSGINLS
jgi:hypothetical protein